MASDEYAGKLKTELIAIARKKKLAVSEAMTKAQVIQALKSAEKSMVAAKAPAAAKSAVKKSAAAKPAAAAPVPVKKAAQAPKTAAKPAPMVKKTMAEPVMEAAAAKPAVEPKRPAAAAKSAPSKKSAPAPSAPKAAGAPVAKTAAAPRAGRTERSWDLPQDVKKFFTAEEEADIAPAGDLPSGYQETRVMTLARDPGSVFVYWEVTAQNAEAARAALARDWTRVSWMLRAYDVTGIDFDGLNALRMFDAAAGSGYGARYLPVEPEERELIVAIGLMTDSGEFYPIAFSNRARTFRGKPVPESWEAGEETFSALYAISGGYMPGSLMEMEISSLGVSSFGGASERGALQAREFFLWADCEITVYGGTKPDARLTLQGRPVALRPDGTFSARFALPDGAHGYPVRAVSADGVDKRGIDINVSRATSIP
ncbi:MAG: DUF4912 domain-containing protein [Nitrospinae bacterium]|nr:DUF4912 domain-containing protein [Nitrospinota bacterium]